MISKKKKKPKKTVGFDSSGFRMFVLQVGTCLHVNDECNFNHVKCQGEPRSLVTVTLRCLFIFYWITTRRSFLLKKNKILQKQNKVAPVQDHTEVLVDWLTQLWHELEINWTPVWLMCWLQRNQNSHLQPNISGWIFSFWFMHAPTQSSRRTVIVRDSFLWKPQLENVPCLVRPIREWVCFATDDGVVGNSVSILNRVNFSSNTLSQCAGGQPIPSLMHFWGTC